MTTKIIFENIRQTRSLFTTLVAGLSLEELNTIPDGFANNIVWNYGHLAVSTPALCYQRTGVRPDLEIPLQAAYAKGSRPEYFVEKTELTSLKAHLQSSIDQIERDYEDGLFSQISSFSTATYQVRMSTIEEVLLTTLMHDNLHLGYAMAQGKLLKKAP